jgi:hypothetical protein
VNIDPKEDMVILVATQYVPQDGDFLSRVRNLVYQAIVD